MPSSEAPEPILKITTPHEPGMQHSQEIYAQQYLEALLYDKRYRIQMADGTKAVPGKNAAPFLKYHIVSGERPAPLILVGTFDAFQQIKLGSLDLNTSFISLSMIAPAGERHIVSRHNGIQHDYIFPDGSLKVETPTSVAARQLDGKDEINSDQPIVLSVVCLDFQIIDTTQAPETPPISGVNFFPVTRVTTEA